MNHSPLNQYKTRRPISGKGRPGFALVIALGLMAFILLLLVALTSLVQVETRLSATELDILRARQNALLGLQTALGQLQKEAGPDQRITARGEIFNLSDDSSPIDYWTGVWNVVELTVPDENEDPTRPPPPPTAPDQSNVVWLVSGDNPSSATTNLERVVGEGSYIAPYAADPADSGVYVPKVAIEKGSVTTGHFAYWVGDEGVKAKVNLINPYEVELPQDETYRIGLSTSLKNAPSRMTALDFLDPVLYPGDDPSALEDSHSKLQRITSTSQLALLESDSDEIAEEQHRLLREHFFDLTTTSYGVLSDVRAGGLKFDLTTELEKTAGVLSGEIFDYGPSWRLVRNFYNDFRVDPSSNPSLAVQSRKLAPRISRRNSSEYHTEHGIAPILVASEITFAIGIQPDGTASRAYLTVEPLIALANPYNVALQTDTYLVRWRSANTSQDQLGPNIRLYLGNRYVEQDGLIQGGTGEGAGGPWGQRSTNLHLNRFLPYYPAAVTSEEPDAGGNFEVTHPTNSSRYVNDLRFKIETSFAPGEIKVFTLRDDRNYNTNPYENRLDTVLDLEEGVFGGVARLITTDEFMLEELKLAEGETGEGRFIAASNRNIRLHLYKATDDEGNEINPIKPQNADGSDAGLGASSYPYSLQHIHTYAVAHSNNTNSYSQVLRLKGSEWEGSISRHSAVKTLEHFNVRSPQSQSLLSTSGHLGSAPLYAAEYINRGAPRYTSLEEVMLWEPGALTGDPTSSQSVPKYNLVLFHVPRGPLSSIGELQHLNFSKDEYSPSYQVGSSFPNPFLQYDRIASSQTNPYWIDLPWLLNDALWDPYFFSTLDLDAPGDSDTPTRNARIVLANPLSASVRSELADPKKAANHLLVNGQFNINSTSVEAWKAVLLGTAGLEVAYQDYSGSTPSGVSPGNPLEAPILRTAWPAGPEFIQSASDGSVDDVFWRGFRKLTDLQATELAEKIVDEIKLRGPFLSLAHFINRNPHKIDQAELGVLQAAIASASVNPLGEGSTQRNTPIPSGVYEFEGAVSGSRIAAGPGAITQSDILSLIGSFINVRSDTFVIRAYGDMVNPLGGADSVIARAWCEAVVQRRPEYTDSKQSPDLRDDELNSINEAFGRKFEIVSFRWLSEDEI